MKIIAFAGSNSRTSINKKLVTHAASFFGGHSVEILDLNDYEMPLFKIQKIEEHGMPQLALDFAKKIDESDLLIISFAEHNAAYSTAFKNIYDYISVISERKAIWGNKPTFIMATSPGERGSASVLNLANTTLPHYGANVIDSFSLPNFYQNFNDESGIADAELANQLKDKIQKIKSEYLN